MVQNGSAPIAIPSLSTPARASHDGSGQPHHHRRQPGRGPEVRLTNNGIAVSNVRVAVTQRVQQDGEWRDGDTSFLKVAVWRRQAEHLADSLSKGDWVIVTGRVRQSTWETRG